MAVRTLSNLDHEAFEQNLLQEGSRSVWHPTQKFPQHQLLGDVQRGKPMTS